MSKRFTNSEHREEYSDFQHWLSESLKTYNNGDCNLAQQQIAQIRSWKNSFGYMSETDFRVLDIARGKMQNNATATILTLQDLEWDYVVIGDTDYLSFDDDVSCGGSHSDTEFDYGN